MSPFRLFAGAALSAALIATPSTFAYDPEFVEYYVARDLRDTIPSGTYAGLPNPNFNRLTFLWAHSYADNPANNHYHAKSPYTYTGANLGAATAIQPFNGGATGTPGNFLPEGTFGSSPRLALRPGTGVFTGKFISGLVAQENALLTLKSLDSLAGYPAGSGGNLLFNAGGNAGVTDPDGAGPLTAPNRFTGSMAGTNLLLKIAAISPGLTVRAADGNTLLSAVGQSYALGSGGSSLDFTPILIADAPGDYSVTFTLADTGTGNAGGPWLESGQYTFNTTAAVPEPAAMGLLMTTTAFLMTRRRRATIV